MTPENEILKLRCTINSLKMELENAVGEISKFKDLDKAKKDDDGLIIIEQLKVVPPPDYEKLIERVSDLTKENKNMKYLISNADISSIEKIILELQKSMDKLLNKLLVEYNKYPIGQTERDLIKNVLIPYLEEREVELRKLLNG